MSEFKLTPHEERRVAVEAMVDPRTVRTRVKNLQLPVRLRRAQSSTTAARIDKALRSIERWPVDLQFESALEAFDKAAE